MKRSIISADTHVDLGWLPADAIVSRVPSAWKDRAPHVVDTDDGLRWVADGIEICGVQGVGSKCRTYIEGRWQRGDMMAATGLYSDGLSRPTNPDQRWHDQDRDGVVADVLYGLAGINTRIPDVELSAVISVAYNDWLAEFCSTMPDRYIGLASLPINSAGNAANEVTRAASLGLRGGVLDVRNSNWEIWDAQWDELWATAEEHDFPISFHLSPARGASISPTLGTFMDKPSGKAQIKGAASMGMLPLIGAGDYFGIVFGGALDRYPNLKVVMAESGIGWIPALLARMDWQYENEFEDIGLQLKPSDYWHRQMYATFQSDPIGLRLTDVLGDDRIMYASDYPHPDGTWPESNQFIDHEMSSLSETTQKKIYHDNAARLYHIA